MSAYSFVLQNIFLPCHNLVRGRHYVGRRRFLEESQWWSPDELEAFQWREATALLRHAWKCVPYYRKKFEQAGLRPQDIRGWADWRRLPTLTREEINANRKELCAEGYADKLSPHATGGSSGVPTRFYITELSYDWRTAATQRAYGWTGCTLGERAVYLWGAPIGELRLLQALKTKAYEFVQRQLIFNTFSQDDQLWVRIHERTLRYKPRLIVGYVSSLLQFARFLKQTGRELPGVKAVIAAAEPFTDLEWALVIDVVGRLERPASFQQIHDLLRDARNNAGITRTNEELRSLIKQSINNGTLERIGKGNRASYPPTLRLSTALLAFARGAG